MNRYDFTKQDIINALKAVGIKVGDSLFIHSNVGFFGVLQQAAHPADYYAIFKEAIFEVIGYDGTIVFPSFSYSFCKKEVFDVEKTIGVCGILSEYARLDNESVRSEDANFSVVALGKYADFFTSQAPEYSFGPNSFWERFLKRDGIFCNFNFDAGSTFIHYVERELKVDYRFDKAFSGLLIKKEESCQKVFYHFCYALEKNEHFPDFSKFDRTSKQIGAASVANVGRGQIVSISAQNTFDVIQKELLKDPCFLIKGQ